MAELREQQTTPQAGFQPVVTITAEEYFDLRNRATMSQVLSDDYRSVSMELNNVMARLSFIEEKLADLTGKAQRFDVRLDNVTMKIQKVGE